MKAIKFSKINLSRLDMFLFINFIYFVKKFFQKFPLEASFIEKL